MQKQKAALEKGDTFSSAPLKKSRLGTSYSLRMNLLFIAPIFILYTLFFIYPLVQGVIYSFTDWNAVDLKLNFVGLKNYVEMFREDEYFSPSLVRTFRIAVINVILTNILAMLFAIALTSRFRLNNLFRASIFVPNVISMVVSGFIWRFLFTQITKNLYESTGMEVFNQGWLGDPNVVIYSIIIVCLWQGLGYIMTIYIAALQGIDESLVEAATIDGANTWQTFFKIKLPTMMPVVAVGAFLNIQGSLKIFDIIYSLTGGGPGKASEVAMLNIYREAFVYNRFGYGTAKAVVLSLIIIIITVVQMRLSSRND